MIRLILTYGAIAGVFVGAVLFGVTVAMQGHPPSPWGMAFGYLVMLVALSAVFVAIKRRRDVDLGGVIRFWPAFGLGIGISVVAGILYVLAWEAALAVTQVDFIGEYSRFLIEQERARGASPAALAKIAADMAKLRTDYADPLYRLPMTFTEIFPVGVLVSLVSAGLLRNSRFLPARATPAANPSY